MKKYCFVLVLFLASIKMMGQLGYRYGSSFIEIIPDSTLSNYLYVQTETEEQKRSLDKGQIVIDFPDNGCIMTKTKGTFKYSSIIYSDGKKFKYIFLPRLAIKMKQNHTIDEVFHIYADLLTLDKGNEDVYMVNCSLNNSEELLKLNEFICEMDAVEWCEPMMIGNTIPLNTLYPYQYYLHNTGQNGGTPGIDINVEPAWNILPVDTTLIVAVLDEGVERTHEDLAGRVLEGMTIDYPNEKGDPINDYLKPKAHGTACAGIIAARNNSIGIRGVASGVKILPVNIDPYPTSSLPTTYYEKVANAITWAYNIAGADIISCSYGFGSNSYIANALENAMSNGRNGKGTIVVCASGNELPYSGIAFPANMENTIAVGAIDKYGNICDYSCRGPEMDVVAPSGPCNLEGNVVTTDRSGDSGYNYSGASSELSNTNYTQKFGGTSAACPQVAGVAALILSANPNLFKFRKLKIS